MDRIIHHLYLYPLTDLSTDPSPAASQTCLYVYQLLFRVKLPQTQEQLALTYTQNGLPYDNYSVNFLLSCRRPYTCNNTIVTCLIFLILHYIIADIILEYLNNFFLF